MLVLLLEPASAYCAVAGGVATRKPMARSAVTVNALFMGYLTKYAPEGELEPCRFAWQFLQAFSTNREFTVG